MRTTCGACSSTAATASAPSPTDATISMSARIPSRSSSASRKTWLSSTRRIRIGLLMAVRSLFSREQQVIVRLAARLDVDLEGRVIDREPREKPLERRLVLADEQRQELPRL